MRMRKAQLAASLLALGSLLGGIMASGRMTLAQQKADTQKAPDSGQLPRPDPVFTGKIGETIKDSTPSYPLPMKAAKDAPNVLLILLDDVGFGMCSTFGGPVPTPHMEKLAKNGLTYTRFHTTALCSPTRAALLTGRNHHSCGTGVIIEMGTGYPGYTGIIPRTRRRRSPKRSATTATPPPCSARHTTRPSPRSARPARSTAGPPARDSTISTASIRAKPASTTRCSIETRPP